MLVESNNEFDEYKYEPVIDFSQNKLWINPTDKLQKS